MGGRSRGIIGAALALGLLTPSAAAAEAMYSWTSETRAFSYTKSVCQNEGSPYVVTEILTQEIFNRSSGVSAVGGTAGPGSFPRGSSRSSGRIRRSYSKVVQGPDPAPPEDWTITESLPLFGVDWGSIYRKGKGKAQLDVGLVDPGDEPRFAPPKKVKSTITIPINVPEKTTNDDDGRCVTESRGNVTGTVTITRTR